MRLGTGIAVALCVAAVVTATVALVVPRPDRPPRLWGRAEASVVGGLTDSRGYALEPGGPTREPVEILGGDTHEVVSHGHLTMRFRRRPESNALSRLLDHVGLGHLAEDGQWYCRTDRVVETAGSSWVEFELRDRD